MSTYGYLHGAGSLYNLVSEAIQKLSTEIRKRQSDTAKVPSFKVSNGLWKMNFGDLDKNREIGDAWGW